MTSLVIKQVPRDQVLDLRARVLAGHGVSPRGYMRRDLAPLTQHWAALSGDDLVGCATVISLGGWCLRAVAVDPAHRGQAIGRHLLTTIRDHVQAELWCNATHSAVGFYTALGWQAVGPTFQMKDLGAHQRMVWPWPA